MSVIAKGLAPGDRVVTDGILRVTDGSRVIIREPGKPAKTDRAS